MWIPFKNFIIHSKDIKRSSIIWNALSGFLNAGQASIILIFVSNKLDLSMAGKVTIAYAIANLLLTVAKYGIRNYQVTDTLEKYSFSDYFYSRCFTTFISFFLLTIYLLYMLSFRNYSSSKGMIIFEITLLKMIESFEDVYIGRYQQNGRLDIGAKIMTLRLIVATSSICILIYIGVEIYITLFIGVLSSFIMDIYLLKSTFWAANAQLSEIHFANIRRLLSQCLPLCIGMTLSIYIGNMPKYVIDAYMDEEVQAIFGYIMMPVFIITLLNQFIYQPLVKDLGDLWNKDNIKAFKEKIYKQFFVVAGLTLIAIVGGLMLGLPILSVLYNADLLPYRIEFTVLLLGGSFYALAFYLNVPITIIKKQNFIAYGYVITTILSLVLGKYFVLEMGIMGAALLYLSINIMLFILFLIILELNLKKRHFNFSTS